MGHQQQRWAEEKALLLEELSAEKEAHGFAMLRLADAEKEAAAARADLERLRQECDTLEERARHAHLALNRTQLLLLSAQKEQQQQHHHQQQHQQQQQQQQSVPSEEEEDGSGGGDGGGGDEASSAAAGRRRGADEEELRRRVATLEREVERLQMELDEEHVNAELAAQANDDLQRQLHRLLMHEQHRPHDAADADVDGDFSILSPRASAVASESKQDAPEQSTGDEVKESNNRQSEVEELLRRVAAAETEADRMAREAEQAREEASLARSALEEERLRRQQVEESAAAARQSAENLQQVTVERAEVERALLDAAKEEGRQEVQALASELKKASLRLETKLRRTEKQLDAFRNTASADAKANQQTIASLQAKAQALAQQNQQLQQQLTQAAGPVKTSADEEGAVETIREESHQAEETIRSLREESNALSASVRRLEQELHDYKAAASSEQNQLQAELDRVRQDYLERVNEYTQEKELSATLETEIRNLRETLAEKEALLISNTQPPHSINQSDENESEKDELVKSLQDEIARLRETVSERESQIKLLEASLQQSLIEQNKDRPELEAALNEVSQLRQACDDHLKHLETAEARTTTLEHELGTLREENERLTLSLAEIKAAAEARSEAPTSPEASEEKQELEHMRQLYEKTQQELIEARTRNEDLTTLLAEHKKRLADVEERLLESSALSSRLHEQEELTNQHEHRARDMESLAEQLKNRLADLEEQLIQLAQLRQHADEQQQRAEHLAGLADKYDELTQELARLNKVCEESSKEAKEEKERAEQLSASVDEYARQQGELESQLQALRQANETMTQQLTSNQERYDELVSERQERDQRVSELETQLQQLQQVREEAEQNSNRTTVLLGEQESKLAQFEQLVSELTQSRQSLESRIQEFEANEAEREEELDRLSEERSQTEQLLSIAKSESQLAQDEVKRLTEELAQSQQENANLREVERKEAEERRRKRQLLKEREGEVNKLKESVKELSEELERTKRTATAQASPSKALQWQKKAAELKKQLEEAQREKEELSKLKEQIDVNKKKAQRDAKEKAALRKTNEELGKQVAELRSSLTEAESRSGKVIALQEEVEVLRKQATGRDRKIAQLRQQRQELQASLTQKEQDQQHLAQQLTNLRLETQQQIAAVTKQHQTHTAELNKMCSELQAKVQAADAAYLALRTEFAQSTRAAAEEKAALEDELEALRARSELLDGQNGTDLQAQLNEALVQLDELKSLNHEVLDLLEQEKERHRTVQRDLQIIKEQLATEKGSHAFTLEQLNDARAQVDQAQQISDGLRADLKHAQQQLADTLTLQNEKIEDLQRLLAEQQSANARLAQEHRSSEANVAALTKHIRELKSSPLDAKSPNDSALAKEREEHSVTKKLLDEEKKKTHAMRIEFMRGHIADLEQLHEAQEVIRLFLEAQRQHLAEHSPDQINESSFGKKNDSLALSVVELQPQLAAWEGKLPQPNAANPKAQALHRYCSAVITCITRPSSSITQRELDEHAQELAAALEQGESREKLKKIHANTLLLKRIIASYYKEFVQIPQLR